MKKDKVALIIMPRSSSAWKGSEALWITAAGWAAAAERKFGSAWVLTNDRIASPVEALNYPIVRKASVSKGDRRFKSFIPSFLITLIKDILLWKTSQKKNDYNYSIPHNTNDVALVWEQHDLFPGRGYELAQKFNVPFVIYVHAPQVWEATKWGVKRPGWGKILERLEAKSLKRADIVACVSEQVAEKLRAMGIPHGKIMISPMAVDAHLFQNVKSESIREKYNLNDKLVLGWTGSFRNFHGLDILLKVFQKVYEAKPNARLLLVGDGSEREDTEKLANELGIEGKVIFTGRKSFTEIPAFVSTFDLAIVSARNAKDFHYSPLKLREYLGAGIATLAPKAGEIPKMFQDDVHLKLYNVGNINGTAEKIIDLLDNREKRDFIAEEGKKFILKNGTWDVELSNLIKAF